MVWPLVIFIVMAAMIWVSLREPPAVSISELKPAMNFRAVRVQGTLADDSYRLKSGGLRLLLRDDNHELPVFIAIAGTKQDFYAGDQLTILGRVSVSPSLEYSLRVDTSDDLIIENLPTKIIHTDAVPLAQITAEQIGEQVEVYGIVRSIQNPTTGSRAPYRVRLRDHTGGLMVIYWGDVAIQMANHDLQVGNHVLVNGEVGIYRKQLQLKVRDAESIRVLKGREQDTAGANE